MPKYVHTYVTRGRCECGYLWTTPGSPNVICRCGASAIFGDVLSGPAIPFSESEFAQAVSDDTGIPLADLILEAS